MTLVPTIRQILPFWIHRVDKLFLIPSVTCFYLFFVCDSLKHCWELSVENQLITIITTGEAFVEFVLMLFNAFCNSRSNTSIKHLVGFVGYYINMWNLHSSSFGRLNSSNVIAKERPQEATEASLRDWVLMLFGTELQ